MRVELIDSLGRADELRSAWDELAVTRGRPYAAPAWLLAWAEWAAPRRSKLAIIAVHEGSELVGLAPFMATLDRFATPSFATLGTGASARVEPLARDGYETAVAQSIGRALHSHQPRPEFLHFPSIPDDSPWPRLLTDVWAAPGSGTEYTHRRLVAHVVTFGEGGFNQWLMSRPSKFRKDMRRRARRLEEKEQVLARSTVDTVGRELEHFRRLHHSRWRPRGGSRILTPGIERMLPDVARRLAPLGRFRLWTLEVGGRPVASEAILVAGEESEAWLGGFEPALARYSPSLQTLLTALEDAFHQGERRFHLGAGNERYKSRLATNEVWYRWVTILPPGRRSLRTRASLLRLQAYYTAAQKLSTRQKAVLWRIASRSRRRESDDAYSSALDTPADESGRQEAVNPRR